ncbi:bile acid:sodium symporter [Pseudodesulfovibrio sp. F-1]|uniref:Bile acid:sodium symporter n=1 Tax=Pseudodesulfovibrio alkaliphilus TaxID=2661613 RepID=A0A7K1KLP8_9BACT|nr:bile acid:sodium symporter family protein [Pseudodesulfovibrio alkaliphilus]MUM76822.1 bile acid:sodium symporter [Pseudodesulfovibrio alkaliphilus]
MKPEAIPAFIERFFIPITATLCAVALIHPPSFTWIKPHIPLFLGVIMFGMGLTLEFGDFRAILGKWRLVGFGVGMQYAVMPVLAVIISRVLGLSPEATVGMVLVGSCPGGTASNVVAYLARANVPLSVTLTLASTCLAPILTPAIVYLILEQRVEMDFWGMVGSVFWIVVFPLLDGLILRRIFRKRLEPWLRYFPSLSIVVIAMLIACIMGLNQATLLALPLLVFLAVVLHNGMGLAAGYSLARLARCSRRDARTLAIEVGMQNSGLGVALAVAHFTPLSALPGALFSLWHNVSGVFMAKRWRTSDLS